MNEVVGRTGLSYSLSFEAPVAVHTGLAVAGWVDGTVVRTAGGLPYVPGSTVKGRLRFTAERLLLSTGRTKGPKEENGTPLWRHDDQQPACKERSEACTICRLLGSAAIRGLVKVGDARLAPPWDSLFLDLQNVDRNPVIRPEVDIRPGIAICRQRRTVRDGALFFDETVPPVRFQGRLRLGAQVSQDERKFLRAVGRAVFALGSRKAVGRGALTGGVAIQEEAA